MRRHSRAGAPGRAGGLASPVPPKLPAAALGRRALAAASRSRRPSPAPNVHPREGARAALALGGCPLGTTPSGFPQGWAGGWRAVRHPPAAVVPAGAPRTTRAGEGASMLCQPFILPLGPPPLLPLLPSGLPRRSGAPGRGCCGRLGDHAFVACCPVGGVARGVDLAPTPPGRAAPPAPRLPAATSRAWRSIPPKASGGSHPVPHAAAAERSGVGVGGDAEAAEMDASPGATPPLSPPTRTTAPIPPLPTARGRHSVVGNARFSVRRGHSRATPLVRGTTLAAPMSHAFPPPLPAETGVWLATAAAYARV